jgi:hypothetical protein
MQRRLVISAKKTLEKLCSGVDDPMQAPAFDHDNQDPFLDSEYTIKELNFMIKNLRIQSSSGRDGIDYFIIRNLPNVALEILLEIYNNILRAIMFPDDWEKYIPKNDKTNVRPISLASCVCKVLERMINMRISWWKRMRNFQKSNMDFGETRYAQTF